MYEVLCTRYYVPRTRYCVPLMHIYVYLVHMYLYILYLVLVHSTIMGATCGTICVLEFLSIYNIHTQRTHAYIYIYVQCIIERHTIESNQQPRPYCISCKARLGWLHINVCTDEVCGFLFLSTAVHPHCVCVCACVRACVRNS